MADFHSGYVALVGKPNVGKSTLINTLLNFKLSIVSPKPQTTRHKVLGILTGENFQALFLDTPGIMNPNYPLQRLMQERVKEALADADLILVIVEPFERPDELEISKLRALARSKPFVVAINKIDLAQQKERLLPIIEAWTKLGIEKIYLISALHEDGIAELKNGIIEHLPAGPPFYPPDQITERPERFFVAEIIRGKVFQYYGEEIPYSTAIEIEEFREQANRKDLIRAVIYVEKPSQKGIIIGQGGKALKRVGEQARKDIENFLNRPVFLELWVKVQKDWRKDEPFIKEKIYRG
jgi:GTP-binding protein Era